MNQLALRYGGHRVIWVAARNQMSPEKHQKKVEEPVRAIWWKKHLKETGSREVGDSQCGKDVTTTAGLGAGRGWGVQGPSPHCASDSRTEPCQ